MQGWRAGVVGMAVACTLDSSGAGMTGDGGATATAPGTSTAAASTSSGTSASGGTAGSGVASDAGTTSGNSSSITGSHGTSDTGGQVETTVGNEGSGTTGPDPLPYCDATVPELVGCYPFADLASGVLDDASHTGNDGTVIGASIEPGPLGDAAGFSASSEVAVPAHPSTDFTDLMTIEMFVRIDELPGSGRAGLLDRDGQYSILLYADDRLRCGGSGNFTFWDQPTLGEWLHLGCVRSPDFVRLYVNGTLASESAASGAMNTGNTNPMALGDTSPAFEEPLPGAIGGLRLWSVARTQAELCDGAGPLCDS